MNRDVDQIIQEVKLVIPEVTVDQLRVSHPADDDGIWFFSLPGLDRDIQIESPFGMCPFIIETNEERSLEARKADSRDAAVSMIVDYLQQYRK